MNNKILLVGRVAKDPVVKNVGDNNTVTKFSIAVDEYSSKKEKKTLFFEVDAWNGLGERVMNQLSKGREVVIEGRLSYNTKTADGDIPAIKYHVVKLVSYTLVGAKPQAASTTEKPKKTKSAVA